MNDLRRELRLHGQRRKRAQERARLEMKAITALAREAREAGMAKTEIAELAQISRPALDAILRS